MREINLYPHQEVAIDLLRQSLRNGDTRPILKAPCGFGKTVVSAWLIKSAIAKGVRVGFIVPRLALVDQSSREFDAFGIDHGVIQGLHPLTDPNKMCQVISAQSIKPKRVENIGLFIVDECHMVYKHVSDIIKSYDRIPFIGLTATPYTKGLGKLYTNMVEPITTESLVDHGYLHDPDCYGPDTPDMTGVSTVGGDYNQRQAGERAHTKHLVGNIVDNWVKHGDNRQTFVFAANVGHSQDIERRFVAVGVNAKHIDAYTDSEERRHNIAMFNAGVVTVLTSVGVLSTGVDCPSAEIAILARPTKSLMLHIQQVGRIARTHRPLTRLLATIGADASAILITASERLSGLVSAQLPGLPHGDNPNLVVLTEKDAHGQDFMDIQVYRNVMPNKTGCTVFDHSGNISRLGYFSDPGPDYLDDDDDLTIEEAAKRDQEAAKRKEALPRPCPQCYYMIPAGLYACPKCGYKPQKADLTKETDDELIRLDKKNKKETFTMQQKRDFYAGLMYHANARGYKKGWASHCYRDRFGVWPQGMQHTPAKQSGIADNYILHRKIKNARTKKS